MLIQDLIKNIIKKCLEQFYFNQNKKQFSFVLHGTF